LDDFEASFKVTEGHRVGHFAEVNFQDFIGKVVYSDRAETLMFATQFLGLHSTHKN